MALAALNAARVCGSLFLVVLLALQTILWSRRREVHVDAQQPVGLPSSTAAQTSRTSNGLGLDSTTLVPQLANVPLEGDDSVETLWQRPPGTVRAAVLLLHGCSHQGTDWWPPGPPQEADSCHRCAGLPEEVRIVREALARSLLPIAVTSADRESGCWSMEDLDRVEKAVLHVYQVEGLPKSTPLYAFGASSGGAMAGALADTPVLGRTMLKCRIPQIMSTPGSPRFSARLTQPGDSGGGDEDGEEVTWPAPPTLFIHMPKDEQTAFQVKSSIQELREGNVTAAELHCNPLPITDSFFSSRIDGVSLRQSQRLAFALRDAGLIDSVGLLKEAPGGGEWRDVMHGTGVPAELRDTLQHDASRVSEEINVAWARHEMCGTFAAEMLRFCEEPRAACAEYGWTCDRARR